MTIRRNPGALVLASLCALGLFACGEDGKTIPDGTCPELPLFHYAWVDAGRGEWVRRDPSGKPLTAAEEHTIDTAPATCVTHAGNAVSLEAGVH